MDMAGLCHGGEEGQPQSLGGTGMWEHIPLPAPEAARAALPGMEMVTPGWAACSPEWEGAALAQQLRLSPMPKAQGLGMGVAEPPDSWGR